MSRNASRPSETQPVIQADLYRSPVQFQAEEWGEIVKELAGKTIRFGPVGAGKTDPLQPLAVATSNTPDGVRLPGVDDGQVL